MSAKHTPGPWTLSDESKCLIKQDLSCIGCSDGVLIASACSYPSSGFFPSEIEGAANARLISAAPELLTSLKELLADCTGRNYPDSQTATEIIARCEAAILKATGETT